MAGTKQKPCKLCKYDSMKIEMDLPLDPCYRCIDANEWIPLYDENEIAEMKKTIIGLKIDNDNMKYLLNRNNIGIFGKNRFYGFDNGCLYCVIYKIAEKDHYCKRGKEYGYIKCGITNSKGGFYANGN